MVKYFRNLMRHIILLLVIVAITVVAMYFVVIKNYESLYQASASMLVSSHADSSNDFEAHIMLQEIQISERIVNDIPELIFGTRVRMTVNAALEQEIPEAMTYDEESYRQMVETEIALNTRVIRVAVRHPDPDAAILVAETLTQTTRQLVIDIAGQDFIHIISAPNGPARNVGLTKAQLWPASMLGGLILGMALVLVFTLSERYPAMPVMASIPGVPALRQLIGRIRKTEHEAQKPGD